MNIEKHDGSATDYTEPDMKINENGVRTLERIELVSVSLVSLEEAPAYLIGGKWMKYPLGSLEPVESAS